VASISKLAMEKKREKEGLAQMVLEKKERTKGEKKNSLKVRRVRIGKIID